MSTMKSTNPPPNGLEISSITVNSLVDELMNGPSPTCEAPTSKESPSSILSPELAVGPSPSSSPDGPKTEKSGPAPAPASPSRQPEKAKGKKTRGISGPISFGSSPSAALQRSLESRLRRRLDVNGSLEYALTWKHWDTESDAPICALRASARRTSVNDSTGWPTCRAIDGTKGQRTLDGVERERERKGGQPPDELPSVVMFAGWQTTTTTWMSESGRKISGKPNLQGEAWLAGWSTAAATTWGGSAEAHLERKRKAILAGAKMGLVVSCLDQQATFAGWPTTTRDSKSEGKDGPNRTGAPSLPALALGAITELFLVPTGRRVVLAPEFSLWLMGFPEAWVKAAPGVKDWLEAQAALELEYSKALETQSSPSSPPSLSPRTWTQEALDKFADEL